MSSRRSDSVVPEGMRDEDYVMGDYFRRTVSEVEADRARLREALEGVMPYVGTEGSSRAEIKAAYNRACVALGWMVAT